MNAITIKSLSKTYIGQTGKKKEALSNLNLNIKKGELFGFIGPNGAGKSTTIKLLLNLINPTSGSAFLFDKSVLDPTSRKNIGFLPENPYYYDFLTAYELLKYAGNMFEIERKLLNKRIEKLLKLVDLYSMRNTVLRKYSKGMVQRAGIAMSMISDPDLLILDEPASGLDPVGRKLIVNILCDLRDSGKTIFFSSHILHDVETICDRAGIIVGGKLRVEEKISTLLSQSREGFEVTFPELNPDVQKQIRLKNYNIKKGGKVNKVVVPDEALWFFLDILKGNGIKIYSVEPKRRTMEDVFMENINLC